MPVVRFEHVAPASLDEALGLLAEHGRHARLLAGGTDLLVKVRAGLAAPRVVIGLKRVPGLDRVTCDPAAGLTIGATALLADVAGHPDVRRVFPALAGAIAVMANVQVRNMGTVVGNICNASPCADTVPILMALGAEVVLASLRGERAVPLERFFLGPGLTVIAPDEIAVEVRVPSPLPGTGASYHRLSPRGRVDLAVASAAVALRRDGGRCADARIVLGAVAPVVMRAARAEQVVTGSRLDPDTIARAAGEAAAESRPISDVRASAEYRRTVVAVLVRRALAEAWDRAAAFGGDAG